MKFTSDVRKETILNRKEKKRKISVYNRALQHCDEVIQDQKKSVKKKNLSDNTSKRIFS